MATERAPYPTAAGVEAAIKDAARRAAHTDPTMKVNERIRLEHFNRRLSRVFSEGADSQWLLKGGTGVLARVASARSTLDIDLYRRGFTLDEALSDLRRLAAVDLGDHFQFRYIKHVPMIAGEGQPYIDGYRVTFGVMVGVQARGTVRVDLAVGAGITAPVAVERPASALDLPRLASHKYRLYPVVDQVADKVCATVQKYDGQPSSRTKDLVDLVILAVTQDIDGGALTTAIQSEIRRRRMEPVGEFSVPNGWGPRYRALARPIVHCAEHPDVASATEVVGRLVNPALEGTVADRRWVARSRTWI